MKEKIQSFISTGLETIGFFLLIGGVAYFSVPISAIVAGIILIIAGGLAA